MTTSLVGTTVAGVTIDPDNVEFFARQIRAKRIARVAHYFQWEASKVDGKPYVDRGQTFCGEWMVRRTGRDVPTEMCTRCEQARQDRLAEVQQARADGDAPRNPAFPDSLLVVERA